jgi:hypothetical protein
MSSDREPTQVVLQLPDASRNHVSIIATCGHTLEAMIPCQPPLTCSPIVEAPTAAAQLGRALPTPRREPDPRAAHAQTYSAGLGDDRHAPNGAIRRFHPAPLPSQDTPIPLRGTDLGQRLRGDTDRPSGLLPADSGSTHADRTCDQSLKLELRQGATAYAGDAPFQTASTARRFEWVSGSVSTSASARARRRSRAPR